MIHKKHSYLLSILYLWINIYLLIKARMIWWERMSGGREREKKEYEDASTAVWLPLGAIIKNVKWLCAQMLFVSLSLSFLLSVYLFQFTELFWRLFHTLCKLRLGISHVVLFVGLIKTPTHINNYNLICFYFSLHSRRPCSMESRGE